jgi:3',5'-cyclic AMP phosphodiesterase CpdA
MLLAHLSDPHLTTGVLAGHGEPAEYETALAPLDGLDIPVHVVPGRDDGELGRAQLA